VSKTPKRLCGFFFLDVIFQALQEGRSGPHLTELGQSNAGPNEMVLLKGSKQSLNNSGERKSTQLPSRSVTDGFFRQALHRPDGL